MHVVRARRVGLVWLAAQVSTFHALVDREHTCDEANVEIDLGVGPHRIHQAEQLCEAEETRVKIAIGCPACESFLQ
eukprot:7121046-Prymnesium_polylepis.1